MLRGNGGQNIFFSDDDRIYFESLISEGIKRFGHRIHAYCWMNNHVHLAVQVANTPLSKIIQNLSFRYTKWINKRRKHPGHLFQGRYKAILIDAENYLLELVRYIHLNPVRAKLVKAPEDYKWSGHRAYLGNITCAWLTTELVLSQLADDLRTAIQKYEEFVFDGIGEGYRKEFHSGTLKGRVLGDDRFIEKVLSQGERGREKRISLKKIMDVVCKKYKVRQSELSSGERSRKLSGVRTVIAYLLVEYGEGSMSEYGICINRDISTLSNGVRGFRIRLKENKELRKIIEELDGELGVRQ
ncbi:MAG: transposase [Thermodesulfobacteriota bacterium]